MCIPTLDIRDTVKYKEVMKQYPFFFFVFKSYSNL